MSIDEIDSTSSAFASLTVDKKAQVLDLDRIKKFSARTSAVYQYLVKMMDMGKSAFSIPAMLIPAMLGMAYKSKEDQSKFITRFLKEHGKEGVDWTVFGKKSIFSQVTNATNDVTNDVQMVYPVPGTVDEKIVFRRDCGNKAKFPLVTPHFARVLLMRSAATVGRELVEFHMAVHDEVLKFVRGEVSVLAPVLIDAVDRAAKRRRMDLENDDLEISVNERRMNLEISVNERRLNLEVLSKKSHMELEALSKNIMIDNVVKTVTLLTELFAMDERDRIHYKDLLKTTMSTQMNITTGAPAIEDAPVSLINDGRGHEISISQILQRKKVTLTTKESKKALQNIGSTMARKWRLRHVGEQPPKRSQLCGGKMIDVNGYYECDLDLMEEAIAEVLG